MTINEVMERAARIFQQPAETMRFTRLSNYDPENAQQLSGVRPEWGILLNVYQPMHFMDANGHLTCRDLHADCAALEDIADHGTGDLRRI